MEYNVYCPSRARPHCVEVMERYFGDRLKLFVHESEIDDYEPYVKVCISATICQTFATLVWITWTPAG